MRFEKFVRRIERTDPEAGRRMRDLNSDAGVYLFEQANWKGRVSDLIREADEIKADIERQGFWQHGYEWRMATDGSERIEPNDHGFRVETTCHGEFCATVPSLPVAVEASRVLACIQKDLFWTLGWSSWERQRDPDGEPYLERLSTESREGFRPRLDGISAAVVEHGEWKDDDVSIRPGVWRDYDGTENPNYEVAVNAACT